MNIYWEKQRGDLCRLHSINAFYGYNKFSEKDFNELCEEYDKIIRGLKSINMDGFAEGRNIISYILDITSHNYVLLIPINNYKNSRKHLDLNHYNKLLNNITYFFEFNKTHVWFNKKINSKWYKIDSLCGVNETNVSNLTNNGYLLILDNKILFTELGYYLRKLDNILIKDTDFDKEILFYNLYHILKYINLDFKNNNNNTNYINNSILLKNIFIYLTEFIEYKRSQNFNNTYQEKLIKKIDNCIELINL
jgi:hypothetical protein